jgi:hypothetical protein
MLSSIRIKAWVRIRVAQTAPERLDVLLSAGEKLPLTLQGCGGKIGFRVFRKLLRAVVLWVKSNGNQAEAGSESAVEHRPEAGKQRAGSRATAAALHVHEVEDDRAVRDEIAVKAQ